jgi:hypothetical protein
MELRDYQKDIVRRGVDIIADHRLLYLQMEGQDWQNTNITINM